MNRVKVYDSTGKCVDSFTKPAAKDYWLHGRINMTSMVRMINRGGFYLKRQLKELKKP